MGDEAQENLPIINSCFGVIFEEGQFPLRVYLVHNSPDPLGPNGELGKPEGCGLPGGGGKLGETPFEAAFREIKDEAGIITKVATCGGKSSRAREILYEEKYVMDVNTGKPALNKIYIFHLKRTNSGFGKITETSETSKLILATLGNILTMPLARKFVKNADGDAVGTVGTVENPEGIYFSTRERIFGVAQYLGYDFYDLIPNLDDLFPKIREEEVGWYIHGLLSEAVEKKEQERANRAKLLRVPDDELIEKYAAWAGGAPNDL